MEFGIIIHTFNICIGSLCNLEAFLVGMSVIVHFMMIMMWVLLLVIVMMLMCHLMLVVIVFLMIFVMFVMLMVSMMLDCMQPVMFFLYSCKPALFI